MRSAGTTLASLATVAVASALSASAFRFSDEPLRQKPLMTTAEVVVGVTRFNNWLIENHASLPKDKIAGTREHAYLLIDSIVKGQRADHRSTFSDFERFALKTLFNWATELDVYGAGLLARHFARAPDEPLADPHLPSDPFELRLEFPYFFLTSRQAPWQLQFPYYFMIWEAKRFSATNGLVTDLAIASTSFASHEKGSGRSQATLMFMYSPGVDCAVFDRFWLDQLGMGAGHKTKEVLLPRSQNYSVHDHEARMLKEVTLSADGVGCTAFAFLGLDGTFQANRVSYLDFIQSVSRPAATSNYRVNPSIRAVTSRAKDARAAPARPAGYAER